METGRHREALRPRPEERAGAEPGDPRGFYRTTGLPDRSLPGQRDRPECPGFPVRQRHLRADLEPALRRPHPDHGGGRHWHRAARKILRDGRRLTRYLPESFAATAQHRRHGSARQLRCRYGPRREGQSPQVDPPDRGGQGRRPWAVRSGLGGRPAGPGLPAGAKRVAGVDHRNLRRRPAAHRQLALGRNALLPAHRQAVAQPGVGDRHPVQECPASSLRQDRDPGPGSERARDAHPATRGRLAQDRGEDPGPGDAAANRQHGLLLRLVIPDRIPRCLRAPGARLPAG